ncbi:AHH domain-containing protein [Aquiflexum sp.]|uniref:AHH domain-containing protein n=1 Tax=Aquiflexum sp. TaxID=1872584 RepID=UPI003593D9D4
MKKSISPPPSSRKLKFSFNRFWKQFLAFLIFLITFSSCIEEQKEIIPNADTLNEISKVKEWFDNHKQELKIRVDGNNQRTESHDLILPFFEKEPDWDKFHIFQFPDGRKVYEVNLSNREFFFYDLQNEEFETTDSITIFIQNIMFVENNENGRFDPLIVRYFPNDETSIRDFDNISYQNIGEGWTGKIDIWTYDERHFIGFNVENGVLKTTSKLNSLSLESSKLNISGHNFLTVDCITKPRLVTYSYCQASPRYAPPYCSHTGTYSVYEGTETICWPSGGTTGQYAGGNYSFEGGGGGGTNSYDYSQGGFWANYQPPTIPEPGLISPNQMVYSVLSPFEKLWWDNVASESFKNELQSFLYSQHGDYDFAWEIVSLAVLEEDATIAEVMSAIAIDTKSAGYFSTQLNSGYINLISPKYININNQTLGTRYLAYLSAEMAILKRYNPSWSTLKIYWEANKGMLQLALDLGGMVPIVGEICDLTNAGIYAVSGDTFNATISVVSAIPIAGWYASGYKYVIKAIDLSSNSKTVLKWFVKQDGSIIFGDRSQLRKVLGLVSSTQQAHHLIPWEMANHPLVQKAAKSADAFHLNEALNGIPVPSAGHLKGHNLYNQKIGEKLDLINSQSPTNDIAFQNLTEFIDDLSQLIQNNPSMNMGQISNLIN